MKKLLLVLLAILLVGCTSKTIPPQEANNQPPDQQPQPQEPPVEVINPEDPKSVINAFGLALRNGDFLEMNKYLKTEDQFDEQEIEEFFQDFGMPKEMLAAIFMQSIFTKPFHYGEVVIDGDKAIVPVTVTAPDILSALPNLVTKIFTLAFDKTFTSLNEQEQGQRIAQEFVSLLQETKSKEYETKLNMTKSENRWTVDSLEGINQDFFSDIFSGQ